MRHVATGLFLLLLASVGIAEPVDGAAALARFDAWRKTVAAAPEAQRARMIAEGVALARARRAALLTLMRTHPAAAAGLALPQAEQVRIPPECAAYLERRIRGRVSASFLLPGIADDAESVDACDLMIRGRTYRALFPDGLDPAADLNGAEVEGLAVDGVLLVTQVSGVARQNAVRGGKRQPDVRRATFERTLKFQEQDVEFTRQGRYDAVYLRAAKIADDAPGAPAVPVRYTSVLLPVGARNVNVEISADEVLLRQGVRLAPQQAPVPLSAATPPPPVSEDPAVYGSPERFPAVSGGAESGIVRVRGWSLVMVRLNPVRYIAPSGELYLAREMRISVAYDVPARTVGVPRQGRRLFRDVARAMAINPDEPGAEPQAAQSQAALSEGQATPTPQAECDYLIITSAQLRDAFLELAEHRSRQSRFSTAVVTLDEISAGYAGLKPSGGTDLQTRIRECISDYVNNKGTVYVVLGGDSAVVPDRDCRVSCGGYEEAAMPTDAYYSGLDGTWDEDGDGVYGESRAEGDLLADVLVGRIPVNTAAQARDYIRKVIKYETVPPVAIVGKYLMGGVEGWDSYVGTGRPTDTVNDGHAAFRDDAHPRVSDMEMWSRRLYRDCIQPAGRKWTRIACLFDTLTSWDFAQGGDYAVDTAHLRERFNEGWNVVSFSTHGNRTVWAGEGSNFTSTDAAQLTNLTAFVYTIACLTGAFDTADPALSEAFLRNPKGGALAYFGCSRYGWGAPDTTPASLGSRGGPSFDFAQSFFGQLFIQKRHILGESFVLHKGAMASRAAGNGAERWIEFGLNYQGDPALQLIDNQVNVSIAVLDTIASEPGTDTAKMVLTREGWLGESLAVNYRQIGTASYGRGGDYETVPLTTTSGQLTLPAGTNRLEITVKAWNDILVEPEETVSLVINPGTNYTVLSSSNAWVTLVDDDFSGLPKVSVEVTTPEAAEAGGMPAEFRVTRRGSSAGALTVGYELAGTVAAADYREHYSGSLVITAGYTSVSLPITAVDDALVEGVERLTLTLRPGAAYEFGVSASGTVSILDNEQPHLVTVEAVDAVAAEDAGNGVRGRFRFSRTGDATLELPIRYTVDASSTASADDCPEVFGGIARIPAGASFVDLEILPVDDAIAEPLESVRLVVAPGAGPYVPGEPGVATVDIRDNDNLHPSAAITNVAANAVFETGDPVPLAFSASDPDGRVTRIEVYCDGAKIGEVADPAAVFTWIATTGMHVLTVVPQDAQGAGFRSEPLAVEVKAIPGGSGDGLLRYVWTGLPGDKVADLTSAPGFPEQAQGVGVLSGLLEGPEQWADDYGARYVGYFMAPKDGVYVFGLACDEAGELWLSSDEAASNRVRIAQVVTSTDRHEWNRDAAQKSGPVMLKGGRSYFFEVLHKEALGADHLAVGLDLPGGQGEWPVSCGRFRQWEGGEARVEIVETDGRTGVSENGGEDSYQVRVTRRPVQDLVLRVVCDPTQVEVQPAELRFTAANWLQAQTVRVCAKEDPEVESKPHFTTIRHQMQSGDAVYRSFPAASVTVSVEDNDFDRSAWARRMRITLSGYTGARPLANFPVLLTFAPRFPQGFLYSQVSSSKGFDLRFADATEARDLPFEIEKWDALGYSSVWVQVPELAGTNTQFWMYWGNPQAVAEPLCMSSGLTWAAGYAGVYHMTASGSVPRKDSTPCRNDAVPQGYDGDEVATGLIGSADRLDGVNDALRIPDRDSLDFIGALTISAWVKAEQWAEENVIVRKESAYRLYNRRPSPTGNSYMTLRLLGTVNAEVQYPISNLMPGQWYYLTGTFDAQKASDNLQLYVDGTLVASQSAPGSLWATDDDVYAGIRADGVQAFKGYLDEVRLSAVAQPADWVQACWLNQKANSTFLTYGPVQLNDPDADDDRIPDAWERYYCGSVDRFSGVGGADADGDGCSDRSEYLSGTDPLDPASKFEVRPEGRDGQVGDAVIRWASRTGRAYRIDRTTNMPGGWQAVESRIPATPPLNVYTDRVGSAGGRVFYRIGLSQ